MAPDQGEGSTLSGGSPPLDPVQKAIAQSVERGPEDEDLNDDERQRFNWQSRYNDEAKAKIHRESVYVVLVVIASLTCVFLTWHGKPLELLMTGCTDCSLQSLRRYSYVFFSGVLGGGLFGLKYLYKVVARGWWNEDRAIWRYASPLLSGGLAFAAGALAQAGIFGFADGAGASAVSFVALGFIVGYFADKASGKMQEVAETLFGKQPAPQSKPKPTLPSSSER